MAQNTSKKGTSSFITKAEIKSNEDPSKVVNLLGGTETPGPRLTQLMYYESILQDTVKADITFIDTGGAVDGKTALQGLPIVGTEEVNLKFKDNNDNEIKIELYINKVNPLTDDTRKSSVTLNLVSEEFLKNEEVRLNGRYDGKISDHIEKILKKSLKTKKKVDIEPTSNNYNFIGNNRKPYYALNWLSKYSVPTKAGKEGKTGGYFFFETSKGFTFKSIDGLFSEEKKKSLVYNESTDHNDEVPAGYDTKVLEQQADNSINAQEKFQMGAYGTRLVVFNPFNCYYEVIKQTAEETKKGTELAGKDLPKFNDKFKSDFTRTTYMLIDAGTLPSGGTEQQISKSKEPNLEPQKVLNQTIRRYNQMFAGMQTVTIPGDFSLHAGDVVFLDTPPTDAEKSDDINKQTGGKYIIADLCHYISPTDTYTKLNLVRDSFGRKGNHTSRTQL